MLREKFNLGWSYKLGTNWGQEEEKKVTLPHDWSVEYPRNANEPCQSSGGYFKNGEGTYRKIFKVSEDKKDKRLYIEFEGVYMNSTVKLNGNILGFHPYGYTSFYYDMTPYIKYGEDNIIEVIVANRQPNTRWYCGSGIYRDVWFIEGENIHIKNWGTFVSADDIQENSATLSITTTVENLYNESKNIKVVSSVIDKSGKVIASAEDDNISILDENGEEIYQDLDVSEITLWSVENPYLYTLKSEIYIDDKSVDTAYTSFGIRSIDFNTEEGFLLNGKKINMKGGCVHHDNGIVGAASFERSEERRVELLKQSGYNALRCAHNPPSPSFLNACDRLGILVINEAFDCWRLGKNTYDYNVAFEDWWDRDIESMVLRDRNHPSVIMWSIGNEIVERSGISEGYKYCSALADYTRSLDPTRPVTSAVCHLWEGGQWKQTAPFFQPLDIGGYNYLYEQYETDHAEHPDRIIAALETFPNKAFENWEKVENLGYVIGDFVWTAMDYFGESGIGHIYFEEDAKQGILNYPWHISNCGDLDICGFKRPQSYYRDAVWNVSETPFIAVHKPTKRKSAQIMSAWGWEDVVPSWTWPGWEGETLKVEIYARCEKVELFLNGKSMGEKLTGYEQKYRTIFEIPYTPGEIKAVGYTLSGSKEECTLKTAGKPASIKLTADRTDIKKDINDLSYITVGLYDENGVLVPCCDTKMYFNIHGAGRLLAVGNSNPVSEEMYTGNERKVYNGRCMAVIASNGEAGKITLNVFSEGLVPQSVVVTAK